MLKLSFKFIFKKNPVYCISFAWVAIDGVICLKTYSGRLCVYIAQTVDSEGGALCHYMRPFDTDRNAYSHFIIIPSSKWKYFFCWCSRDRR